MGSQTVGELNITMNLELAKLQGQIQTANNRIAFLARQTHAHAKSMASGFDAEMSKLGRTLKNKFGAADLGKDILRGLGIGSGFALAQQVSDGVVGIFEMRAKAAEEFATATERAAEAMEKLFKFRRTDEQNIDVITKQIAAKEREIDSLLSRKTVSQNIGVTPNGAPIIRTVEVDPSAADKTKAENLKTEISNLRLELETLQKTVEKTETKKLGDQLQARKKDAEEAKGQMIDLAKISGLVTAAMDKQDAEMAKLSETYADIADPSMQWQRQLKDIDTLMKRFPERAKEWEEAGKKVREAWVDAEMGELVGELSEQSTLSAKSFREVTTAAEEFDSHMKMMWSNVSDRAGQAFADMLIEGENAFASLADIVARSMIEITARLMIVNPILNSVMGFLPGFTAMPASWGAGAPGAVPGKAVGGMVAAGSLHEVNEVRPEMLTVGGRDFLMMGSQSGYVSPRLPELSGGGRSGDTYHFNYNIEAGVTRADLMPVLKAQEEHTIARWRDMQRRGKA